MKAGHGRSLTMAVMLALGACTSGPEAADAPAPSAPAASGVDATGPSGTETGSTVQDIMELEDFAPIEPGTYSIDPDTDPSTPLQVEYDVPADGWIAWPGAAKNSDDDHVLVTITTVRNLTRDACLDHSPADPPVGSSVDDLATALADLAPFRVTSAPEDVTIYGYRGQHLELMVPDLQQTHEEFAGCVDGTLATWMAPVMGSPGDDVFYGYGGPNRKEEFWILDVDGTRLMIAATWSTDSPRRNVSEMRDILESIRVEP